MADMKFSCPECGQHIAYGEAWVGRQIECPTCHSSILVPKSQAAAPMAAVATEKPPSAKLSAGVTQVARSTAHAPATVPTSSARPPRTGNPVLKFSVLVLVIAALGWVGYFYGLPLLSSASQQEPNATAPAAKSSNGGAAPRGPLGEMNGAMDVSDTLDSGASARPHPVAATNVSARPRPAVSR